MVSFVSKKPVKNKVWLYVIFTVLFGRIEYWLPRKYIHPKTPTLRQENYIRTIRPP